TCYDRSIWQQSATLSLATNSSISRPVALTRRSVLDGAIPGICARRQNPLRKQPAKGAGGGDPEWECEYQTQGRALPLLLKKKRQGTALRLRFALPSGVSAAGPVRSEAYT